MVLVIGAATTFLGQPGDRRFSREAFDDLPQWIDGDADRTKVERVFGPPGREAKSDGSELEDYFERLRPNQQCATKSTLLAVLLGSVGVSMTPLWFALKQNNALFVPADYFPAGIHRLRRGVLTPFGFHQVGFIGTIAPNGTITGTVYDPSTGSADQIPFTGLSFAAYIAAAFPRNAVGDFRGVLVNQINVGSIRFQPFRVPGQKVVLRWPGKA
jgi:hypothetical protein